MEQTIQDIVVIFNDFLWSKVLIILLVICGIYFTTKTRFMQFRMIGDMVKVLLEPKSKVPGKISPFQAFCISMAARVGTGNITGIALAIALGGPGAIFWMWIIAIIGSASSFVESTLAQIYKVKDKGGFRGVRHIIWNVGWANAGWGFYLPFSSRFHSVWFSMRCSLTRLPLHLRTHLARIG